MRRFVAHILILLSVIWPVYGLSFEGVAEASLSAVTASSAVLFDASRQQYLYKRSPDKRRPPASTEKVMTALVAIDRLSMDQYVRVSARAAATAPTEIWLREGEYYRVRDLLKACLIRSANDAAVVLAEATAGTEWEFAILMNEKAKKLGLKNTRFRNATGLPNPTDQYTTTRDLTLLLKEANQNSFVRKTLQTRSATIRSRDGRSVSFQSRNKMFSYKVPVYGKTGYTLAARHCFVGEGKILGKRIVISVLGSRSLWKDVRALVDYATSKIKNRFGSILSKEQTVKVQGALKRLGYYSGGIDGIYGPKTISAVKAFQKSKKITIDGIAGRQTLAKLEPHL